MDFYYIRSFLDNRIIYVREKNKDGMNMASSVVLNTSNPNGHVSSGRRRQNTLQVVN